MENLGVYLTILTAVSILSPLVIEAMKKLLGEKQYNINYLSAGTTAIIALVVCVAYNTVADIPFTVVNGVYTVGVIFFSILGSLCGYDKVYKVVFEIFSNKEDETK
jgi:hypothetical protein